MNKALEKRKWVITVLIVVMSFGLGFFVRSSAGAGTSEPGTAGDPIAAQSYVDQMASFQVVDYNGEIPKGSRLIGYEGTEFVLRAGSAKAIEGPGGGLADLTNGNTYLQGDDIKQNHHILISRSDGRGFSIEGTQTVVLVKGKYRVE